MKTTKERIDDIINDINEFFSIKDERLRELIEIKVRGQLGALVLSAKIDQLEEAK